MNIIPRLKDDIKENEYCDAADYEKKLVYETDASLPPEGYRLSIRPEEICLVSSTEQGRIWGRVTLQELCRDNRLPICEIEDAPKYPYRGFHIDCSRHFHSAEEVKKIIGEAAQVKMNYFHWHLSDDQGWRVEIKKYPKLTEVTKDYYTQDQIRDVVAFATAHGVEVIPELDMPGHTRAVTAAYPSLSCSGTQVQLATCGGIYPIILCPGQEEVFDFVTGVLDELLPLFPGKYFHIGGDEAPKHEWKKCPRCQQRMKEENLGSEWELQGYFYRRITEYVKKTYGKKILCWNDSLEAENFLAPEDTVQYWSLEHKKNLPDFVGRGGHFVYSDMFDLYYDYPAAMSPMKRSYTTKPVVLDHDYSEDEAMLGFECCTWSEYIQTPEQLENRIFPRIYALAENAWSGGCEENYRDFTQRLEEYHKRHTSVSWGSGDPKGIKKLTEKLGYAKTMSTGMSPEVREMTVEAAAVSEEFMDLFKKKMLK